jgi:hypothetical protein
MEIPVLCQHLGPAEFSIRVGDKLRILPSGTPAKSLHGRVRIT